MRSRPPLWERSASALLPEAAGLDDPVSCQYSLCTELKTPGHPVIEVEHAVLVCRAESQGCTGGCPRRGSIRDSSRCPHPRGESPNLLRIVSSVQNQGVPGFAQLRGRGDHGLSNSSMSAGLDPIVVSVVTKFPKPCLARNSLRAIADFLDRLLRVMGSAEDDHEVGAVLLRREADHFERAVAGHGREGVPVLGNIRTKFHSALL